LHPSSDFQPFDGLLFSQLWGLVLLGGSEFALLGSHHELSELRILRKLQVALCELLLINMGELTSLMKHQLSDFVLHLEHFANNR